MQSRGGGSEENESQTWKAKNSMQWSPLLSWPQPLDKLIVSASMASHKGPDKLSEGDHHGLLRMKIYSAGSWSPLVKGAP